MAEGKLDGKFEGQSERAMEFAGLEALYKRKDGILAGPFIFTFDVTVPQSEGSFDGCCCRVEIRQGPHRTIMLLPGFPVRWDRLAALLSQVERLLMVFEGRFIPLCDVRFFGSAGASLPAESDCAEARDYVQKQRLNCYCTPNWMLSAKQLVDARSVLTTELFAAWLKLLDELGIVNQVYLYAVSDSGMPRDVSLAFVAEMAEPMVELMKAKRSLFPELHPGKRGTTLAKCLKALIGQYGDAIFKKELAGDLEALIDRLVGTRVQVMHIKRNQESAKRFDGVHCVLYINKLSLLYRVMLLDLLGVGEASYSGALKSIVDCLDDWMRRIEGTESR